MDDGSSNIDDEDLINLTHLMFSYLVKIYVTSYPPFMH